jgi:hypothetical protein
MTALSRRALLGATAAALPAASATAFPVVNDDPTPRLVADYFAAHQRCNDRWCTEVHVDFDDPLHKAEREALEAAVSVLPTTHAGVLAQLMLFWGVYGPCCIEGTPEHAEEMELPEIRLMANAIEGMRRLGASQPMQAH